MSDPKRKYAHMCRDGHAEIGHNDSFSETCPLCRALAEVERLRARLRHIWKLRDEERAEVERLTAALEEAAAHHEDQARCWNSVDDESNAVYHAKRVKVFRAVLTAEVKRVKAELAEAEVEREGKKL